MPQVDLETIVSVCGGGNDRKIACETLADGDNLRENPDLTEVPPDFPPESFWLSKDQFSLNLKSKASLIGLSKTQKASYDISKNAYKRSDMRLMMRRSTARPRDKSGLNENLPSP
ncbi:uncharacterized protein LOC132273117 [Cornus florida]|uniref:uncharacterized protein LOC132273117 n=1 Tax=Cornus florida TaxID=4283 RepID=UPI0028972B4C|nr:uncharacterized protein LOC132273117 [Cornus florida]